VAFNFYVSLALCKKGWLLLLQSIHYRPAGGMFSIVNGESSLSLSLAIALYVLVSFFWL
jgi:hypothetical protein